MKKITRIIKNKQYQYIAFIIISIAVLIFISSFNKTKTKRITYISNDLKAISDMVNRLSKSGFEIECIVPQSITETVIFREPNYNTGKFKISKGDVLLIMIKK